MGWGVAKFYKEVMNGRDLRPSHKLHYVELQLEMWPGHKEPPAAGSDTFDIARDVTRRILAILKRATFIAERQGPRKTLRMPSCGKITPTYRWDPLSFVRRCNCWSAATRQAKPG